MKNIRVLIAEDDVLIAEHLKTILKKNGYRNIELGHKKKEVIDKIISFNPDIALLDINLNTGRTGIEIAEFISNNFDFPVVFITALSDKNTIEQALSTNPYGYIIKPFKAQEIVATIHIALKKHNTQSEQRYIFIKDGYFDAKIGHNEIFYIKTDRNYIEIHTKLKTYIVRQSLSMFMRELKNFNFIRVHKSFVVNINFVTELGAVSLMIGKLEIPISKTYYDAFKDSYTKFS